MNSGPNDMNMDSNLMLKKENWIFNNSSECKGESDS